MFKLTYLFTKRFECRHNVFTRQRFEKHNSLLRKQTVGPTVADRKPLINTMLPKYKQYVAQLSQKVRAAWWVSFGQKWKTIFCRQYRSIFNQCDVIGLQSYQIR